MTATVLSGPERRRRWTSAEKLRIVKESLAGVASVAEVARQHDVYPNLLHAWQRQARTERWSPRLRAAAALRRSRSHRMESS